MYKNIIKGNTKTMMRRIKQQWGNFTDEEFAQIQGRYDEYEQKLKHQHRFHREQIRAYRDF